MGRLEWMEELSMAVFFMVLFFTDQGMTDHYFIENDGFVAED